MKIIIGLGNPGQQYSNTRHNVGFMAVDRLAEQLGLSWEFNKKFNAEIAKNGELLLAKPQTYMNNSGVAVSAILSYYKLLPKTFGIFARKESDLSEILIVIHDDLDITLGKYKISAGSRSAGHNGVQSIINRLKTKNFQRVRVGIRTAEAEKIPADKFVLSKFSEENLLIINSIINEIISLIQNIIS